jgi:hypothetical protein
MRNLKLKPLADSRIHIVGTVRDSAIVIESQIDTIFKAFSSAFELSMEIIESDSEDETLSILRTLETKHENLKVMSLGKLGREFPRRTERLAYCRNLLLKNFRENIENYDYFVVADLDGVNDKLTAEAVISCWVNQEWDVCTANQAGPYYDIWALRHEIWCPNDFWKQYYFLRKYGITDDRAKDASIYSRMITLPADSEWIQVTSAFGGLAIYRSEILRNAMNYLGIDPSGNEICEHVELHEQLSKRGFKIFINPGLVNTDFTDHSHAYLRSKTLNVKVKNLVKKTLKITR